MSRRILITGGSGFVGRHLLQHLLADSANDVYIVDDLSIGPAPRDWEMFDVVAEGEANGFTQMRMTKPDLGCFKFCQANFAALAGAELGLFPAIGVPELPQFDEVYHLASIVGGRQMIEGEPLRVGLDLAIDALFFYWAVRVNRPGRVLYASSSAAYPVSLQSTGTDVALREEMIDFESGVLCPDLTYGWSKLTGEMLARLAVDRHKLSVAVIRPFSGYGEDQDLSYPVPAIALRVANHDTPVRVWGSGLQGRDFVHIDDCATGMVRACRHVSDATPVNLGSGVLTSFLDLARLMVRLEGYDADVCGTDAKPVGVAHRYCINTRAQALLGWAPTISLEAGMQRVIDWAHHRRRRAQAAA